MRSFLSVSFVLAGLLFLLGAVCFFARTGFARRCLAKFRFPPEAKAPYRLFGAALLAQAVNLVAMSLPVPYHALMLATAPVSVFLLLALCVYLLISFFRAGR